MNADSLMGNLGIIFNHNMYSYCSSNPILRIDSEGKQSVWNNQVLRNAFNELEVLTKIKHAGGGSLGALSTLATHQESIQSAADEFGVEKEMIQAIIFRELICYGYDDVLGDYMFEKFGRDSSTGLGQISASTAIEAEKAVMGSCDKTINQMWPVLQDPNENIRYVAMNIKSIITGDSIIIDDKIDIEPPSNDTIAIFARYNSAVWGPNAQRYSNAVYSYYLAFKENN